MAQPAPLDLKYALEREIRDMAFLPRWAIVRTRRTQSVAEHSYLVAMYGLRLLQMYQRPDLQAKVLECCLTHDIDELITGDIPSPVKRGIFKDPAIKDIFKKWLTSESTIHFPWLTEPTDEVKLFVSYADILEAYTFLLEERRMGNTEVLDVLTLEIEPAVVAVGVAVDRTTGIVISSEIIAQTRHMESMMCSRLVGRDRISRDFGDLLQKSINQSNEIANESRA